MTRKELEHAVQALADGTLTEEKFAELQVELQANPESREFYRRSMEVEMLLVEAVGNPLLQRGMGTRRESFLKRQQRRNFSRALMAAAAVLVVAVVALALVMTRENESIALSHAVVAGTQWSVEGDGESSEKLEVVEGSTVRVLSGTVRLEDDSGVVMLLRGPAEVSFPQLHRPVLKHGWLWVDSGESAEPLEVTTPELLVRDIGTRFGLRVRDDRAIEIHLIEGKVEINARESSGKPLMLEPESDGVLISAEGSRSERQLPLAADPFPGLPELLRQGAAYDTTVLSQAPTGYWRLDEQVAGILANEIPGGIEGRFETPAVSGEKGVGRDGVFQGFADDNRAIFLSGNDYSSLLYNLDIPDGVSREEGGVSFWIRRLPGDARREILWLAGKESDDPLQAPSESMMHAQLTPSGQVEFFVENGEFDLLLSSNFSVVDDKWHHIAASWGVSAVELYVDGRRVGRIDDFGSLQQGILRGRQVRFGKPSEDLKRKGAQQFTGWVDEIAIWRRPLSGVEVAHQFKAAKGAGEKR